MLAAKGMRKAQGVKTTTIALYPGLKPHVDPGLTEALSYLTLRFIPEAAANSISDSQSLLAGLFEGKKYIFGSVPIVKKVTGEADPAHSSVPTVVTLPGLVQTGAAFPSTPKIAQMAKVMETKILRCMIDPIIRD